MFRKFGSSLNKTEENSQQRDVRTSTGCSYAGTESLKKSSAAVGLRILVQASEEGTNLVVKQAFRPPSSACLPQTTSPESCFLKTCFLCNQKLSPDKDVYMYRGDQGYCSIECRNRQIVLDDMKELEASTKQMLKSPRHCHYKGRRETRALIEELRRRHKFVPGRKTRELVS